MSGETYVRALLWMDQASPMDPAELIVWLARPRRWPSARFAAHDIERAARAIRDDPNYFEQVYDNAQVVVERAGVIGSGLRLIDAYDALHLPVPLPSEAPDAES